MRVIEVVLKSQIKKHATSNQKQEAGCPSDHRKGQAGGFTTPRLPPLPGHAHKSCLWGNIQVLTHATVWPLCFSSILGHSQDKEKINLSRMKKLHLSTSNSGNGITFPYFLLAGYGGIKTPISIHLLEN